MGHVPTYTHVDDVEWRSVGYLRYDNGEYRTRLRLPRPLADWGVFDGWERERTISLLNTLRHGDHVIDIGAEHGWLSCVIAQHVGPENVTLVEPTVALWPNIRMTWERNLMRDPYATFVGFISSESLDDDVTMFPWPEAARGSYLVDKSDYADMDMFTARLTLDDLVTRIERRPDALNIDVEGAELLALQGGERTLTESERPLAWVSVHPEFGVESDDVVDLMRYYGYSTAQHLATDHEEHWFFS